MKKIILILALVPLLCTAQIKYRDRDSIKMSDEITYIKKNLVKCHTEYKIGTITMFSGLAFSVFCNHFELRKGTTNGFIIAGIGALLQIHSHKWLQQAGFGIGGTGVRYRFK